MLPAVLFKVKFIELLAGKIVRLDKAVLFKLLAESRANHL
ncbi:Uncharacterised protein [uncultured archaeon]|nr:Uncharacterised protein [uncultured archaeon]